MCEQVFGIEPATEDEKPRPRRTQADKWALNLTAATQYYQREGHLRVPRKHVERILVGEDQEERELRLGAWIGDELAQGARGEHRLAGGERRAEGLPVQPSAGVLSQERREQLEDIAPSWCPAWPVEWQRGFHLTQRCVRLSWDNLTTVQQWLCQHILGIQPATEDEKPKPRMSQADKWAMHLAAARQFFEREGHLRVPRKHTETITMGEDDGEDQVQRELRLGAWISNQRSRAATLTPERVELLSAIGPSRPGQRTPACGASQPVCEDVGRPSAPGPPRFASPGTRRRRQAGGDGPRGPAGGRAEWCGTCRSTRSTLPRRCSPRAASCMPCWRRTGSPPRSCSASR
ncbi:helicase associated domain-containing protein [Streptomyces flaveolus]|uniref:helicase associated domain-containing protein n=1 Tax=Streptomyces flaveolus TaxID=67297 RepID=UPI003F53EA55